MTAPFLRGRSRRAAIGIAAVTATALALTGCSGSDSSDSADGELSGDVTMLNYAGWMGADEVAGFEDENPGVTITETDLPSGGAGGIITLVRQNTSEYDFALLGSISAGAVDEADIIASLDEDAIPSMDVIPEQFREAYPWGLPVEQGKVGIVYNSDLVSDPPTSWAELFEMIPDMPGEVLFPDYDVDVFSIALLALGYDINTTDEDEMTEAAELVESVKPDLKAFLGSGKMDQLVEGSASIAVAYDYETAATYGEYDNIVWLEPEEGMPAYLDGWVAFDGSENIDEVEAFMEYHLQPENYADFINTTGASYLIDDPEYTDLIDSSITENPALAFNEDSIIHYEEYIGGDGIALRNSLWEQIQAS